VCDRHNVPLKAAALQFGLAHPAVAATIPGPRSQEEVEENVAMIRYEIPPDLWSELKAERLIPEEAPVPE
jgi:D-threo-aldose 1-dehydrogenase